MDAMTDAERQVLLNLIRAHDLGEDSYGCVAHGEGQHCCLDAAHPLGAGLRQALGLPYPETWTSWGPGGTTTHRTKPHPLR